MVYIVLALSYDIYIVCVYNQKCVIHFWIVKTVLTERLGRSKRVLVRTAELTAGSSVVIDVSHESAGSSVLGLVVFGMSEHKQARVASCFSACPPCLIEGVDKPLVPEIAPYFGALWTAVAAA